MKIAVIIPVYNEAWNIRRILYNLLYVQDYSPHILKKIIVVCSGCTDGSDVIAKEIASNNRIVHLIIENKRSGKANAINIALKDLNKSKNIEAAVFLSADVVPQRGALKKLLNKLQSPFNGCSISNPTLLNVADNVCGKFLNILWGLHNEMNKLGWHKVTGEMFAVKCNILEEIPQQIINDDLYIEYLVKKHNLKFVYVPDAKVYMWGPQLLFELLEQRRRVNRGHLQFAKIYRARHFTFRGTMRLLLVLLLKHGFVDAFQFVSIEGLSRIIAFIDNLKGINSPLWKMIHTSKGGYE